jgi:glycosyltransferase involved in cell wall biosynthesis
MRPSRISVALATFNGERYLAEQLESIAQQTLAPHELVVSDDGSTDSTLEIVEAFAHRAPFPVRSERNLARLGFADNFLTAAGLCEGELIAFADQDDVWLSTKLERAAAAFTPDVVLAVHTCQLVDEALRPLGRVFPRIERRHVAAPLESHPWFHMPGMAMLFASHLLTVADWHRRPRSHFAPGERIYHDEWIHVLAQVCGRIAFLPDALTLYRQHGVNVTGAPGPRLQALSRDAVTVGFGYYSNRAAQAEEWSNLFAELGAEADAAEKPAFATAAEFFGDLARRLRLRLEAYAPAARARRLAGLMRIGLRGAYGRRSRGGFGLSGFARDILMIALGRR